MVDIARVVVFAGVALICIGCSDHPTRYPVSGKVLVDGQPLAAGTIRFVPESGRPVTSPIQTDGSFMLAEKSMSSSRLTDGVMPGIYRVSVSAAKIIDEDADEVEWLAPSQYADFRTSGIEVEIDCPHNDLIVALSSAADEATAEEKSHAEESKPLSLQKERQADTR